MRVRPTGRELLSTAGTVLREHLLPHTPEDDVATVRAIGSTMARAANGLEFDEPARRQALEMLKTARTTLRDKLLSRLPKERQYDARLIAKAIAIASMELQNGDAPERAELARLAALLHRAPPFAGNGDVRAQLESLYTRLAAEIRHGPMEPGTAHYAAIYAHLCAITREGLGESHPAYLESRGKGARYQNVGR